MEMINLLIISLIINIILTYGKKQTVFACGLIGFSGENEFDVDKIKILMLSNITRGKHSTGMYNNGKVTKETGDAIDFLANNKIVPENIFIGHDRWATIGGKTNENAHPFEFDDTILVHNGTLTNHWKLCRDYGYKNTDYLVDSEILTKIIANDKNYSVLSKFEGAAALIWTDRENPNRIFVFRNEERPLFHGKTEEGMYISSIENSLKIIGCSNIKAFKVNYLYCIDNGKINLKNSKLIPRKAKKKTFYNDNYYNQTDKKSPAMFSFAKITKSNNHGLVVGKWYLVKATSNAYLLSLYSEDGSTFIKQLYKYELDKISFGYEEMEPGDFVISARSSENNLITKGTIYSVLNVYWEGSYRRVSVSKLSNGKSVSWGIDNFRKATDDEIDSFYADAEFDVEEESPSSDKDFSLKALQSSISEVKDKILDAATLSDYAEMLIENIMESRDYDEAEVYYDLLINDLDDFGINLNSLIEQK